MNIRIEALILLVFFSVIALVGTGWWMGTVVADNKYADFKPHAKSVIKVNNKSYYCQGE